MIPHRPPASFADQLRHYRKAAGLTQASLAERAGLSVNGVQKLERGVTHPYRDTTQRLAAVLQLSAEHEHQFRAAALAALVGVCGDAVPAAHLFGAAEAQWQASGAVRYTPDQPAYARDAATVRARLDERAFAAAWTAGRAMTTQQAIAYALEATRGPA